MGNPTLYFDRCFGKSLPDLIRRAKPPFGVEYHHDPNNNFPQNMEDDEWLNAVGSQGWIVFSHDRRFHSDGPSITAIRQHKIGCFYLSGASLPIWDKFRIFAKHYKRVEDIIRDTRKPFIYHVKTDRVLNVKMPN